MTYGFEDGEVVKIGATFHLIITEFIENPLDPPARFTRSNIAHWTSTDRVHWTRMGTLVASTGDRSGTETHGLCGGFPVFNPEMDQWNLFYGCTRSQPDDSPYPPLPGYSDYNPWLFQPGPDFIKNQHIYYEYSSRAFRAVSITKGFEGIGGPYSDEQTIFTMDRKAQPWEGLWGVGSLDPYKAGKEWLSFFTGNHSEGTLTGNPYNGRGMVGLASAPTLSGPWTRLPEGNPVGIDMWLENPVVTQLADRSYIAVYNAANWEAGYSPPLSEIGYTTSQDGIHWSRGRQLVVQPKGSGQWAVVVRTPLGLVPESDGSFTIFYTGSTGSGDSWSNNYHMAMGFVTVNLK